MFSSLRQKYWNYYFIIITGGASILTWTINYLYHPMMIRYLSGADFAIFQSLMSLFNIFWVIWAWLWYYLTQQVSIHKNNSSYLKYIRDFWLRFASRRGIGLCVFFSLLSPAIAVYLHLPSLFLVVLIALSYVWAWYSIVYWAMLQGNRKFEYIAWVMIWWSLCRIWFGAGAIYFDLGVAWAIAAVSIWSLLAVALQYVFAKSIWNTWTEENRVEKSWLDPLFNHKGTIVFFIGVSLLTMLLTQIDIFIVQHKFFWEEAGNYVAVSVLAKFVFFLAAAIETVYFPELAKSNIQNVSQIQIRNYFFLLILLIISCTAWAWLLGSYVLYLFKAHLVAYQWRLQPLIIASWSLFIFTTIFKLLVSWQEFKRAYRLAGCWIVAMIRLHIMPTTLVSFVPLYTWTMLGLSALSVLFFLSILYTRWSFKPLT